MNRGVEIVASRVRSLADIAALLPRQGVAKQDSQPNHAGVLDAE
jgi:hypothetical protein